MGITYDNITSEKWRDELSPLHDWNERHLLTIFALLGIPERLLDVGCGIGTMVNVSAQLGVNACGIDQLVTDNKETVACFTHHNLVDKYDHPIKSNMVLCLEVAEHLDQSAHATLCDTCADNLMDGRGNFLVFSAAFPNQGGIGHVSERPSKYWMDQFSLRKLNYRMDLTVNLSLLWSNIHSPLYWLASNVLIFEK
jgi:cyclopropane fatty-acyl-phospholipid synthase-like methyltransferase